MSGEKHLERILSEIYIKSSCADGENFSRNAIEYMNGKETLLKDISVRIVKGGTYRIKGYYLENNELSDIRGASAIITKVQDEIVPQRLMELVGFDSVLYNGGGNLFALVPEDVDTDIGLQLEETAQKYLITADSAYMVSEPVLLSELLGRNYRTVIASKENELDKRKKVKINADISPCTEFLGKEIFDDIHIEAEKNDEQKYCEKCRKRIARYREKNGVYVCGGCLHKYRVGLEQKTNYADEYREYLKSKNSGQNVVPVYNFSDIDSDRIAVIYADGNNMGGIIQNFTKITDMVDFSAFVKKSMPEIVYGAMEKCGVDRFEIVAMGGDDIFMIVPGARAVKLALELVKNYNNRFAEKYGKGISTLSAGVCVAKTSTPVKVMLESAEDELSDAKEKVKLEGCDGSLSYIIFDSIGGNNSAEERMVPFTVAEAETVLKYVEKNSSSNSRLRNIAEAYENAESKEEANLFYAYMNAKEPQKQIVLPKLDNYELDGGYYKKDEKLYTLWNELLDLIELNKGDKDEKSI